jgi:hypothetical protein
MGRRRGLDELVHGFGFVCHVNSRRRSSW